MRSIRRSSRDRHFAHRAFVRDRLELVAVARAHVRHVHAQHPEQAVAFAVVQFAERVEERAARRRRLPGLPCPYRLWANGPHRIGRMRTPGPSTCCRKTT